jgi:hypothetical protein
MLKNSFCISVLVAGCVASTALYAQQCDTNTPSVTPNSRYQLLNNGKEVKDLKTGLIWQRCLAGQGWNGQHCTGNTQLFEPGETKTYLETHAPGWRLPTLDELLTLKSGCWQSSVNRSIFPSSIDDAYASDAPLLSSTPYTPSKAEANVLYKQNGYRESTQKWYWALDPVYGQSVYKMISLPALFVRK